MTIFVADAHRDDRKHLVVRSDEKGTALVELQSAIYPATVELSLLSNRSLAVQFAPQRSQCHQGGTEQR